MAWTKEGLRCGTDEIGNTISEIQIVVLPQGQTPAADLNDVTSDNEKSILRMQDFPKPKEMEDINMSWPEFNTRTNTVSLSEAEISAALEKNRPVTVMSEDASEGYVSIPDRKEEKPAAKPAPVKEEPKAEEPTRPYWYTQKFTATGVMQTGPAWPMAPGDTKPSYPATAKIESMTHLQALPRCWTANMTGYTPCTETISILSAIPCILSSRPSPQSTRRSSQSSRSC